MARLTGYDAVGLMEAYNSVYIPQELPEDQIQEDFQYWVNSLVEEGYDLSDYTWDDMFDFYMNESSSDLTEDNDSYDAILSHLINEGYVNSVDDALVIMANMSEDWKNDIIEGLTDYIPWFYRPGKKTPRDLARAQAERHLKSGTPAGQARAQGIQNVGVDMMRGIKFNADRGRPLQPVKQPITGDDLVKYSGVMPPTQRHAVAARRGGQRLPYGYPPTEGHYLGYGTPETRYGTSATPKPPVSDALKAANRAAQAKHSAKQSTGTSNRSSSGQYRYVKGGSGGVSGMSAMPNMGLVSSPGDIKVNVGPSQKDNERYYNQKYGS